MALNLKASAEEAEPQAEEQPEQTVFPMPQEDQPDPVYGRSRPSDR